MVCVVAFNLSHFALIYVNYMAQYTVLLLHIIIRDSMYVSHHSLMLCKSTYMYTPCHKHCSRKTNEIVHGRFKTNPTVLLNWNGMKYHCNVCHARMLSLSAEEYAYPRVSHIWYKADNNITSQIITLWSWTVQIQWSGANFLFFTVQIETFTSLSPYPQWTTGHLVIFHNIKKGFPMFHNGISNIRLHHEDCER